MSRISELQGRYMSGKYTCVLVIPKGIARKFQIDNPSRVIIEGTEEGILIKKLAASETASSAERHTSIQYLDKEQVYNEYRVSPEE